MKPLFPDHLYSNWKAVYDMPSGHAKDHNMKNIKLMTRGNLQWLIRRLIGGVPSDGAQWIKKWIAAGEMMPPSEFTRKKRYEDLKRKNKQHS